MKTFQHRFSLSLAVGIILLTATITAHSQHGEFGLRFMPAFSKFDINTSTGGTIKGDIKMGYGVGALLGYHFSDYVGIQGEIIYSSFAQKYSEDNLERNINLKYINIPLLLSLNTGKSKAVNFGVVAGPQIGLNVGSKLLSSDGSIGDPVLSVKKGDLGFAYGAGFDFGLNPDRTFRLGLGFRGVHGLVDIGDNSNTLENNSYYILDKSRIKVYSGYIGLSWMF